MSEQYYTAKEAREKLGLSNAMFHRKVGMGHIPRFVPPGKKLGVYPKRDIDALALAMDTAFELPFQDKFEFSKSTPGDQYEEMEIGIRCFGKQFITPLRERIEFQRKSEFTFWSLKADGRVVGYVSMFRFPPKFLDDILTGERIEREITVKEVLPFSQSEPFDVYIDVLAMDPQVELKIRRHYAWILVTRFADALLHLLGNKYKIRTLYTVTATQEGDRIVNELGFRLMPGKSKVVGRTAYIYDLEEEGIERLKALSRRHLA